MITRPNLALVNLKKRADDSKSDPLFIRDTFVDVANTMDLLQNRNPQIVLGRRGSGKTHTLLALADRARTNGDIVVFLDLRDVGSNSSIYGSPSLTLAERGTRLFLDVASAIHEELRAAFYTANKDPDLLGDPDVPQRLDEFAQAATEVRLQGSTGTTITSRLSHTDDSGGSIDVTASKMGIGLSQQSTNRTEDERQIRQEGHEQQYVHFGRLRVAAQQLLDSFKPRRLWLLLDEWNSIPEDLQPYVGDLLRRALMAVDGLTLKIGAIQHRSAWTLPRTGSNYVGLELGSDIFADVNLDEFQVGFGRELARRFFRELIFKHVIAELEVGTRGQMLLFADEQDFINQVFQRDKAFEELVDSAEGVPRDGISIVGLAAQTAREKRIAVPHVRDAARRWHEESKLPVIEADEAARRLMYYIVDAVIEGRKTRGFVVRQAETRDDPLFSFLVDQRLLHRIRRSISSHDEPGVRFDAYVVDYGFYVDRKATRSEPLPLLFADASGQSIDVREVPTVDYRSVRTAILTLSDFYQMKGRVTSRRTVRRTRRPPSDQPTLDLD